MCIYSIWLYSHLKAWNDDDNDVGDDDNDDDDDD
jgi:hypothetical protein